jgi:hypothetical protein
MTLDRIILMIIRGVCIVAGGIIAKEVIDKIFREVYDDDK